MPNPHPEVTVARQSSQRPDADPPPNNGADDGDADATVAPENEVDDDVDSDLNDTDLGPTAPEIDPAAHRALWEELRIDPVEIALPAGTGYTLRAYRLSTELTPTDTADRDEDDPFSARARAAEEEVDDETVVILDEEFLDEDDPRPGRHHGRADNEELDVVEDEIDDEALAEEGLDEEEDEEEDEEPDAEEVPVFLTHRGKLLLFRSSESLVSFVRSGAPNDLSQVDTWSALVERVQPEDIAPLDEDSYELDLVVENLRGGHDSWDPPLIIEAGEVSRDLAYALRLPAVLDMLSPGSSLDDLDEALRSTVDGGLGGFFGRRRVRKIGAQTASLGWRTIIGKISAAVDWRD
jgi:hypothetical protein